MSISGDYRLNPEDPRAPSLEQWQRMSQAERERVVAALPSEVDMEPPEGDPHRIPKQKGLEALDAFFRRTGRRVYLSSELPIYYPAESMFAPDLIAVCDVEPGERQSWVVAKEHRGLDFALEVTFEGSRKKDLEDNVSRFARLRIPEYFVFDRKVGRLHGYRLGGGTAYEPIAPQLGRWSSGVLGLDLAVEGNRFRFYVGTALVLETDELLDHANRLADELQDRLALLEDQLDAEQQRAQAEQQRAQAEQQRAEVAERRVEELEAELARLRNERRH